MKKIILTILSTIIFVTGYSQNHNLTLRKLTTDTIKARVDSIFIKDETLFMDGMAVQYIDFDTSGIEQPFKQGRLVWDDTDKTLALNVHTNGTMVTNQIGQETWVRVINKSGTDIPNGSAVYVNGNLGDRPKIYLANAKADNTSLTFLGLATSFIYDNDEGFVTVRGNVRELNTDLYLAGTILYLDTIDGGWSNVRHEAPIKKIAIGMVNRKHASDGIIGVNPQFVPMLSTLSDVDTSGLDNGETLVWNEANNRWENDSIQSVSLGTDNQIPVMNSGGTDFEYSNNLLFKSDTLKAPNLKATTELVVRDTSIIDLIKEHATASPAGNNTEIQFNNNGVFGSDTNFTWNKKTLEILSNSGTENIFIGKDAGKDNTTGYENLFIGKAGVYQTTGYRNLYVGYNAGGSGIGTGYHNTAIGYDVGKNITSGYYNTVIGSYGTGQGITSGRGNVLLGFTAGRAITTTHYSTILGGQAGMSNTAASQVYLGYKSGYSNTSGASNTFIGYQSGYSNITGASNTFVGYEAGYGNTASNNTSLGYYAGRVTTGANSVYIGSNAGKAVTSGEQNTIIGSSAGFTNITGSLNTYIGYFSGYYATGNQNTFLGSQAGYNVTTGANNTMIGSEAGKTSTTASGITMVGMQAGTVNTAASQTFIGFRAGLSNTSGASNTFVGYQSGYSNLTGAENAFLGFEAGYTTTSGENVFMGFKAGRATTSGAGNVFIGNEAGLSNTTGAGNVVVGRDAFQSATGTNSYNLIMGSRSGLNASGSNNIFLGYEAGPNNTANRNTFIGNLSGRTNTTGYENTFIGDSSGYANSTGFYNVFLGNNAGRYETGSNKLFIDNQNRTDEATSRTNSLLYGEFSATVASQLFRVNGVFEGVVRAAKYHRIDSINTSTANAWNTVKLDTTIAAESTSGFTFNADSTGIITDFTGIVRVMGCIHFDWQGAAGTTVSNYVRVTVDGVEKRCLPANITRSSGTGDQFIVSFSGTINCAPANVIRLQYYVTNAGMDLSGPSVFDNPIAASINFEQIGIKR
jgi:hypothetical protein